MTRPARRLRLAGGSAVLALVLTGCGSNVVRSGAAAVIGQERITTQELSQTVDRALADPAAAGLASDREAFQRDLLERLVQAEVVAEAARRKDVSVTEGQVDQQYQGFVEQAGGAEPLQQQAAAAGLDLGQVRELARTQALIGALQQRVVQDAGRELSQQEAGQALETELKAVAEDLEIKINPRFGRFDLATLSVVERGATPGRELSSPAPGSEEPALEAPLPEPEPEPESTEQEPEVLPSPTA